MGNIILFLLVAVEASLMVWSLVQKDNHAKEKSIIRIAELVLLVVFLLTGILEWGFRYYFIFVVLLVQAIAAAVGLWRGTRRVRNFRIGNTIGNFAGKVFLYYMSLLIAIICPQGKPIQPAGSYETATAKYTWTDEDRMETFGKTGGNHRKLTVEFWYPEENIGEKYPLVVFSHGAYGFSGSNQSTFQELASHGYVVASINHTYHAFYTLDTEGTFTMIDTDFFTSVNTINNSDDERLIYETSQEWLKLRVEDENFVLDTILQMAKQEQSAPFSMIDEERIGLFGHSLGGASSAVLGRMRNDIDAVIDVDGSMLGEGVGFEGGEVILTEEPYPVPLLNIYAQDHYEMASESVEKGLVYYNFHAAERAVEAYDVIIKDTGHLNFTDLPLFSPFLAKQLGTGSVDARYAIETMNGIVLEFFDCILKQDTKPIFEKEY